MDQPTTMVMLLQHQAKTSATKQEAGEATDGKIRCRYYPRSNTWGWWNEHGKCNKADVVEHYRFIEAFRKAS
jgi:hypothetical protein